ncbi:NPCBM/NEW2 domain-containing protein [Actinoplanes sp. NPDC051851]|uniref:NPCBM/NEW2 domain-containing protein n=1 Tax=Actinoplanes sp. NPDC051851 TaxID=3154753 RepID=UPI00343D1C4E
MRESKDRNAWLSWPAWSGISGLAALIGLAVAVGAWWLPQSAAEPAATAAPAPPSGSAQPSSVRPSSVRPSSAAVTGTHLYELPATSAGQPGPQRAPLDVTLAGERYPYSTAMWTQCAGTPVPQVTFYTGGKYTRLAGTLGVDDSAPDGMAVQVQVYADDALWKWFEVRKGASLPIDLEISPYQKIGLASSSATGCPSGEQLVHLGDGIVL